MKNITGGVARGTDFFDRDAEIAEIVHLVERDHVLLLAPRRVGKTSLMYRLLDVPPPGWRLVYVDVESAASEAELIAKLLSACYASQLPGARWSAQLGSLKKLLGRVGKVGAGPVQVELTNSIGEQWQDVGAGLVEVLRRCDEPTLLMIDEFPMFVRRMLEQHDHARERVLLDWFRESRQGQHTARFLVAGSIGLDAIVARAGLSATINDLVSFRLGPFDTERARAMLEQLFVGERLEPSSDVVEQILRRIDWAVPFHLQLLFSEVLRAHRFHRRVLDAGLVDHCYEHLLAADKRKHFAHWVERLEIEEPETRTLTRRILETAARDPSGVTVSTLRQIRADVTVKVELDPILLGLEHDGYLVHQADRWRFASSLVRDWWLRWEVSS